MTRSALVAGSPPCSTGWSRTSSATRRFVPGCTSAQVLERGENEMVARLAVRRGPLRTEFTTRNQLDPGRSVHMQLVEGPFRLLEGHWSFTPVGDQWLPHRAVAALPVLQRAEIGAVRLAVRGDGRLAGARVRRARSEHAGLRSRRPGRALPSDRR